MKYEAGTIEKMAKLMHEVGAWVAATYGVEKVLELAEPDAFRAMLDKYHEAMAQAIKRPEFRKEAARRVYEELNAK